MQKSIMSMPGAVRASALANNPSWYARLITWVVYRMRAIVMLLSVLSWWTVAYWGGYSQLSFDSIQEGIPQMRDLIVATYALQFVAIVVVYNMELVLLKPLAERGWPCIRDGSTSLAFCGETNQFPSGLWMGIAPSALIVGVWMLYDTYQQTHGSGPALDHLWSGVVLTAIGIASVVSGFFPLRMFMRVPRASELRAASSGRNSGVQQARGQTDEHHEKAQEDYVVPVAARPAKLKFDGIFGMQKVKNSLLEAGNEILADRGENDEAPRNGILLNGLPGNGKTVFAEALAGELGVPFIEVTYGDVSSKWVGEMPKVLSNVFKYAARLGPAVLFIDEIDSFLTSRDSGSNNSEDQKVTNTLLTEIVALRAHNVILIGATNYLDRLDSAAIREGRFDYKVEVTPPDETARIGLLKSGIAKYGKALVVDAKALESVAKRWEGFSVARLIAITKAMPGLAASAQIERIGYDQWMAALREVQGRAGKVPKDTKSLTELILRDETRSALDSILNRLRNVHHVESLGGTLPRGVLFHGLPGTGKTAVARGMAKDAGWAFIACAGPDLIADRKKLQSVFDQAADIRPTILFIDESDDVLRNRQFSSVPDLCNRLLVLMDGVHGPVKDLVVIAATNHPDQVDPALLRAGRFTEKIEFTAPPRDEIPRFVAAWLKNKGVKLVDGLDAFVLADMLGGETIANIEGTLQYALNRAIDSHVGSDAVILDRNDFEAAISVVLPESFV